MQQPFPLPHYRFTGFRRPPTHLPCSQAHPSALRTWKSVILWLLTLGVSALPGAAAPAPSFSSDRLPYRLAWGDKTVVAERAHTDEGDQQVRIVDAHGRTARRVAGNWVEDVRLVTPLVAREQGLLVETMGGNGGRGDFYGFGAGARPRFVVSDATQAEVKDLDGDGTAEVVATYRFEDIDGGGEHHGTLVSVVYAWDGAKYAEATRRFPAATRARAQEYQDKETALERSHTVPADGDGHQNALLGYFANATLAGDTAEARAWLARLAPAWRVHLSPDVGKDAESQLHAWLQPLPLGDGTAAALPTPKATPVAHTPTPAPSPTLIVAGRACGGLRLGAPRPEILARLGNPASTYHLANGLSEDLWTGAPDSTGYRAPAIDVLYRGGVTVQIGVTDRRYATAQGLSTASPFRRVILAYPSLTTTAYTFVYDEGGAAEEVYYDDRAGGIAFCLGTQDDQASSESILGTNPTPGQATADYIIVHPSGKPVLIPTGGAKVTQNKVEGVLRVPYLRAHLRRH